MPFSRKAYRIGNLFSFCREDSVGEAARAIASDMGLIAEEVPVSFTVPVPSKEGEDGAIAVKIPNTDLYIYIYLFENKGDLEYNNSSWFCPIELAADGNLTLVNLAGDPAGRVFRKAGASGSKKLTRLFTDLKVPESARESIVFAASKDSDKILWIPGVGHAEGFTSKLSRQRYGQSSVSDHGKLLKITLERRKDGN